MRTDEIPPHDIRAGDVVCWGVLVVQRDNAGRYHYMRKHYGVVLEVGLTTATIRDDEGGKRKAHPTKLHKVAPDVYDSLVESGLVRVVEKDESSTHGSPGNQHEDRP